MYFGSLIAINSSSGEYLHVSSPRAPWWSTEIMYKGIRMLKKISFLVALCLTTLAIQAKADTIGPVCGSCLGSSYTLTYTTTGTPNVYDIFLTVNATGF